MCILWESLRNSPFGWENEFINKYVFLIILKKKIEIESFSLKKYNLIIKKIHRQDSLPLFVHAKLYYTSMSTIKHSVGHYFFFRQKEGEWGSKTLCSRLYTLAVMINLVDTEEVYFSTSFVFLRFFKLKSVFFFWGGGPLKDTFSLIKCWIYILPPRQVKSTVRLCQRIKNRRRQIQTFDLNKN